jgi:hypothetical protein
MGDFGKDEEILKYTLKKKGVRVRTGINWLSMGVQ